MTTSRYDCYDIFVNGKNDIAALSLLQRNVGQEKESFPEPEHFSAQSSNGFNVW